MQAATTRGSRSWPPPESGLRLTFGCVWTNVLPRPVRAYDRRRARSPLCQSRHASGSHIHAHASGPAPRAQGGGRASRHAVSNSRQARLERAHRSPAAPPCGALHASVRDRPRRTSDRLLKCVGDPPVTGHVATANALSKGSGEPVETCCLVATRVVGKLVDHVIEVLSFPSSKLANKADQTREGLNLGRRLGYAAVPWVNRGRTRPRPRDVRLSLMISRSSGVNSAPSSPSPAARSFAHTALSVTPAARKRSIRPLISTSE
jgi:hypothetical protein